MDTNGSFYIDGGVYTDVNDGLGNVPATDLTANPAESSFYQSGQDYVEADPTLANEAASEALASAAAALASQVASAASAAAALVSEGNSDTSEAAALASANASAASAAAALVSEGNADTSEAVALASAATATTQAGIATTQAGTATTQAGNAATSAAAALVSENNADTSEAASAASAAAAAASEAATAAALGSYAPLASPALTGTPSAPTAAPATNTTQLATTAFVLANGTTLSATTPIINGTAAVGVEAAASHGDHVHPTDTSRAPLASPALTGTPTAPTQAALLNSTAIATTAYVDRTTREKLTAARSYYVLTTGSDSNNGLTNTAGGAFLTIQKAIDAAISCDLVIYSITINVGAGTFAGPNTLKRYVGGGNISIVGAGAASTTLTAVGDIIFAGSDCGQWTINSLKMTTAAYAFLLGGNGSSVSCTNIELGAMTTYHARLTGGSQLRYYTHTISGGSARYVSCDLGGKFTCVSVTVTITGTPAFSQTFMDVSGLSYAWVEGATWSGAATGARYTVTQNSVIYTAGAGAAFLPGNAASGTPTATGGQYL